ncbi:hypothetical protein EJ110_NYTH51836 [Nymphaea thermarum]|nr:hypothetical protein EJ110_NYTH51836 [Nymphaea thermarum]
MKDIVDNLLEMLPVLNLQVMEVDDFQLIAALVLGDMAALKDLQFIFQKEAYLKHVSICCIFIIIEFFGRQRILNGASRIARNIHLFCRRRLWEEDKRRTWAALFSVVYALLLSSSWTLVRSTFSVNATATAATATKFPWPAGIGSVGGSGRRPVDAGPRRPFHAVRMDHHPGAAGVGPEAPLPLARARGKQDHCRDVADWKAGSLLLSLCDLQLLPFESLTSVRHI